jgi:ABC-2 type transport system ATP-binding protein
MIFATHDMQDIEKTCRRLIIIDNGEKLYDGSLAKIKETYGTFSKLEIEFDSRTNIDSIKNVTIEDMDEINGRKKRLVFENSKVLINELVPALITKYNVKDLRILDPEIDEIIRHIYEGSKGI